MLTNEQIEAFLQGRDPQKYIVAVEPDFRDAKVTLIIGEPNKDKRTEVHSYQPFIWFKEEVKDIIYGGKRLKILEACKKYDIKIIKLRTHNENGFTPSRMENGFKFLAKTKGTYSDLINFFNEGGVDLFDSKYSKLFVLFSPVEQFLIQTGKRLFKGFEDYDDLNRFQFDLETEGLNASKNSIFQIGVRDNKGLEHVFETVGNTPKEKRDSERRNIELFFKVINEFKPDIIAGYNSENFDWPFLFERAEKLNIPITDLAITLNRVHKIRRKPATLKLGAETEAYKQTMMYGYNIIDISHAVRRAMAINSEIKSWGLKYITQYSGIAKPNRVYVAGDKINSTWADNVNQYAFNNENGDWYKITETNQLKSGYKIVTGAYIVQRYLCDDLWETEQIDNLYNQASFLISKILPTSFMRSSTMGTAGQWKLIMAAWSYENNLAIPETQPKRDFTGGLSRLLEVGYAKNVVKFDFAALYPKTQLTWSIFPDLDISGVMKGILTYVVDTRDKFKFLTGDEKKKYKKLQEKSDSEKDSLTKEEIDALKSQIKEHKRLSILYDKKQLPLKILANSWFGSYGAPYIFNWGDTDSAEETTCRGRQSLRFMVKHFTEKYGFRPLVLDTDGVNFAIPSNIDEFKYIATGNHWKTTKYANKELTGLEAVLAEFNEQYMEGRMGLDIDDVCDSTINFARKNYANDIEGKIKLVGNSIKSKKMSVYIEEFLGTAIRMLLDGDGHSFINYYYEYVDKIYNYQIPLVKIASKAKVKTTIVEYNKKATMKNKRGNPLPKQAHMELAIKQELDINLGDVLYYVNTGLSKTDGDLKTYKKSKMSKKALEKYVLKYGQEPINELTTQLNCRLIDSQIVERDFEAIKELELLKRLLADENVYDTDKLVYKERIAEINESLFTDDYNVGKYLEAFNKKVKPLLVCFKPEIRDKILLSIIKVKDKTTKQTYEKLKDRMVFTRGECELTSGKPFKPADQDSYEELMKMEDKEIKFWNKVNKLPNFMSAETWKTIEADYLRRMEIERIEGIAYEKTKFEDICKRLEIADIITLETEYKLPLDLDYLTTIDGDANFISRKWNVVIGNISDLFKYESDAKKRDEYYKLRGIENNDDRYELWLEYNTEKETMFGVDTVVSGETINLISNNNLKLKDVLINNEEDEDEDGATNEEDEDELIDDERKDEEIILEDEFDDTYAERPDDYVKSEITTSEELDEWPF